MRNSASASARRLKRRPPQSRRPADPARPGCPASGSQLSINGARRPRRVALRRPSCIKSRQTRGHVSGAAFASIVCESGRQNVNYAMSVPISDIVRRTIRHARRLAKHGQYDWPTSRVALTKILADLEARSPGTRALRSCARSSSAETAPGGLATIRRNSAFHTAFPKDRAPLSQRKIGRESLSRPLRFDSHPLTRCNACSTICAAWRDARGICRDPRYSAGPDSSWRG